MTDRAKAKEAIRLVRAVRNAVARAELNGDRFGMNSYAEEHECGLAACAAGWAALDPYARRSCGLPPMGSVPNRRFQIANDDGLRISHQLCDALYAAGVDMDICGEDEDIHENRKALGMKPLKHEKVSRQSWIETADKLIEYLEQMK